MDEGRAPAGPTSEDVAIRVASAIRNPGARDLLGHPRGLVFLAGTEFWDRISFHGMQALLVLYMVEQLLLPGHIEHIAGFAHFRNILEAVTGPLSTRALASQIFGLYVGFIYFTPIFGGLLGDRVLGRRRAVVLGALLMTSGHFCLAFDRPFLLALLLLILGAGCIRGNLISQVGGLYSKNDRRRADAFQIYFSVVNSAVFIAPLLSGAIAQSYGWHYGFGFVGFGMLAGLCVYLAGLRSLPPDAPRIADVPRRRLRVAERRVVLVLIMILPISILFWIAQTQVWNTYNLWARDHVDLTFGHWTMPVAWLQAADGLGAVVFVPPIVWFWRLQAARSSEPDDFTKLLIGCLLFGAAMAWLAGGELVADASGKIPLAWTLGFYLLESIGYLYYAPIVMALYSRSAPAAVNAIMVGVYYLSLFAGSMISGRLGGLYERLTPARFWLLHAAIVTSGALLILLFARPLRAELLPRRPD